LSIKTRHRRDLFINPSPDLHRVLQEASRHHYELHQIIARLVCSNKPPSIFGLHATADEKTMPWASHEAFYDQPQYEIHMLMHRWSSSHLVEQVCQCHLQLTTVADHVRR